jgi:hypothetical protein
VPLAVLHKLDFGVRCAELTVCVCVCVYDCRTYYKAVCGGGRGTVKDMCYEARRAEACVV